MDMHRKKELIEYLSQRITHDRRIKMDQAIPYRTRYVTLLLEDIFQQHNASAIIRSAECLGVQDLHIIQDKFNFSVTAGVAMGSSKWIDMHRYGSTQHAFEELRNKGYKIIVTSPNTDTYLEDLPLDYKIALIFGTENVGVSEYALSNADQLIKIPMFGFTQSYNVSVSVALCLYDIIPKLHNSSISWQLSEEEQLDVMLTWLRRSIRGWQEFERIFYEQQH
jgi:tRNA (guanosine-2'-O-)-methyltransferase